jgi:hypothetical protein
MPHHFPKNTVQAEIFCNRCMKYTPWRVADGRRQWCMVCYERRKHENSAKVMKPVTEQGTLFKL